MSQTSFLNSTKNILIITSGGDAPGMNASLVSLIHELMDSNFNVFVGIEGLLGLYNNLIEPIKNKHIFDVYFKEQGTIIKTSRFIKLNVNDEKTQVIKKNLLEHNIHKIIILGGQGSMQAGLVLTDLGFEVYGILHTIDNDFNQTQMCIGASSATHFNQQLLTCLNYTAKAHNAFSLVEIMGHQCPWLVNNSIGQLKPILTLTNQDPKYSVDQVIDLVKTKITLAKEYDPLIIVQELIYDQQWYEALKKAFAQKLHQTLRVTILNYLQRGAPVIDFDLQLAKDSASVLVDFIINKNEIENTSNMYVVVNKNDIKPQVIKFND
ncbi:6-phosphofructokinase [Ureaplasma urealyticum]|uniref:6-phosphofructokinase n=1 Tax=Ureaplasma urealyticum TaxID=2130 RepID=A0AAP9ABP0_UREUR|nr:6-phosphofructokinase [Ureaplasma urealyticum]QDI64750.1 6-phosphofructokinase [Ureaplasma urealyticum]